MTHRVALVTGGSRGIGEAICRRLAADGMTVIVASRSKDKVDEVAASIGANGGVAHGRALDTSDVGSMKEIVKEITDSFGGLHVLVNNAGITADNLMMRISEDDYDRVLNTNLKGVFFLSQAVIRPMMRQKWGRVINITSVVGLMGNVGQANYAASKAGVLGLTKSMAKELGSRNVTVNAIAPGYIETDMTKDLNADVRDAFLKQVPLGRMGVPEEIAHSVSFLASEQAGYITGQVLTVDGGLYM
ncbi:MAG: 3-oxoacyl-ACP reductase FabG [Acidobacteria bacterium]|nr:3-oxoacyl-ACP reductase FabG [Acidobacteriota bacterium]